MYLSSLAIHFHQRVRVILKNIVLIFIDHCQKIRIIVPGYPRSPGEPTGPVGPTIKKRICIIHSLK